MGSLGAASSQYGRDVIEGFNFAPAIGDSPFQLEQRLASLDVDADDPVTVFAHLTAPRLSFADKGKAKFNLPDTVGVNSARWSPLSPRRGPSRS